MKSLKVKLFTVVSLFVLMIAMLIIGVWAIGQSQTISLQGSVSFNIADKSLYVKDIRVKSVTTNESSTMPEFVPGYINGDFVLNLGSVASTSGSIGIFFDIINLTDKSFVASTSSAIENAKVSVSGSINGDNVSESDLITTDVISGTIELIIEAPTLNEISLNNIVIDIVEMPDLVINYNNSLGSATYTKEGLNYVLTATLNNNSVFYGWWDSYDSEYRGFTIGDTLTFVLPYTEGMSTTYYADFGTIDDAVFTFTYDSPAEGNHHLGMYQTFMEWQV